MKEVTGLVDLVNDMPRFVAAPTSFTDKLQLNLSAYHADHISLRCLHATADRWREGLSQCATLLSETGSICLFSLDAPLSVGLLSIDLVELPYPGEKRYPHEGWEHIELVLSGGEEGSYPRAIAQLADQALVAPGIKLKQSSPKGEDERLPNPTLAISDGTVTIKFHPHSLRDIVASERE